MALTIMSPAFTHQAEIPAEYTCDGLDVSPPLEWSGIPKDAKSLALIVFDPDAPDPAAPRMIWVHWVLYNLPPDTDGLAQGVALSGLPEGTLSGTNNWQGASYGGPCPPVGRHRYFFTLYALDAVLPDMGRPSKDELEKAMAGHILAKAELIGLYQR